MNIRLWGEMNRKLERFLQQTYNILKVSRAFQWTHAKVISSISNSVTQNKISGL